jgi:hypothetical protein
MRDFRSSGERNGNSLNHKDVKGQVRCLYGVVGADRGRPESLKKLQKIILAE